MNDDGVSRRHLLLGAAAGAVVTAGGVSNPRARTIEGEVPWAPGEADAPPTAVEPGPYAFFTPEEAAFVEAAVARIIPVDELGPGAREVGCAFFIDGQLAGAYGHAERMYNAKTLAYGPMAEVIRYSTSMLSDADLAAVATYLKDLPAPLPQPPPQKPTQLLSHSGEAIYADACSACHGMSGAGVQGTFPALKGDAMAQSSDASGMVHLILRGGCAVATDAHPTPFAMPAFGWKLSDQEIAAVASYVRSAWGNAAPPVSAGFVHGVRDATQAAAE